MYTVPSVANNFGIAHVGPEDAAGDLVSLTVSASANFEHPDIMDGSNSRPPPMAVNLTVCMSGLTSGVGYVLYQYDDWTRVPVEAFNANNASAVSATSFLADPSGARTVVVATDTSVMSFFRAVRADAR